MPTELKTEADFQQFLAHVDQVVRRMTGMSRDDLPDYDYRTAFEDGVLPGTTARRAIRAARDDNDD